MKRLLFSIFVGIALIATGSAFADTTHIRSFLLKRFDMDRPAGSCKDFNEVIVARTDAVCAVTGTGGQFTGLGERGRVFLENGAWVFQGNSCQPGVFFDITCFEAFTTNP
jgi:hypothetical protein